MDIYYGKSYDLKDTFLMEVPNNYLEDIKASKDNLKIKGNENLTVLCTDNKSYELKYVYTTNTFYLLDQNQIDEKVSVSLVSDHTLEVTDYLPKKSQVYKILRGNTLKYNKFDGATNYHYLKKLSLEDFLNKSDMNKLSLSQSLENYNVLEKNGFIFLFDDDFALDITRDILYIIVQEKLNTINLDVPFIFNKLNEKYPKLELSESERRCLINGICDIQLDRILLNEIKTKMFCVRSIFCSKNNEKKNLYMKDFIPLLEQIYRLVFPTEVMERIIEEEIKYQLTGCQDNLFEYYTDFDLRFIKGYYTITFLGNQKECVIINVDTKSLSEKFEVRLSELFQIKEKWPISELKNFLQIEYNFNKDEKLQKYCKVITDANPFDTKKSISYYMLKNKIPI